MRSVKVLRINSYTYLQLAGVNKQIETQFHFNAHSKESAIEKLLQIGLRSTVTSFTQQVLIKHPVHAKSYSRAKRNTK